MKIIPTASPQQRQNNFHSIISSTMVRKKFSNSMIGPILAANCKGVDLEISFSNDLPDFFFGDEELVHDLSSVMLDASIANTRNGIIRINVSADFSTARDQWWLNISVDDCSSGISPRLINYVYGLTHEQSAIDPKDFPVFAKLRALRQKCHLLGGEMVLVNMFDKNTPRKSLCTGNLYLASLPFKTISTDQHLFRKNYLA